MAKSERFSLRYYIFSSFFITLIYSIFDSAFLQSQDSDIISAHFLFDHACLLAVNEKIRQRDVLLDVKYLWQALKILKKQSSSMRWFYRRKPAVAVFSGDVPLCLISKLPLSKEAISFDISYQFSIMVEALKKKNRQVKVRTEMKDKNGFLKFQTEDWIVKTGNIPSDSWYRYSYRQSFRNSVYHFQEGDQLSVFLIDRDPGERIFISNLKIKVISNE